MKRLVSIFSLFFVVAVAPAQQLFVSSVAPKSIVSKTPLWNPDRGFHLESIYQISDSAGYIPNPYQSSEIYPIGFIDTRNAGFSSEGDSITLTQLYVYLTAFWDSDTISQAALKNLQILMDGLREHKAKAILRFAYSRDDGAIGNGHSGSNPGSARTLKHLAQLKTAMADNWDVIAVMEAGFIGTWGEWSPQYSTSENNAIAKAVFSMLPDGYNMVVRYIEIRDNLASVLTDEQLARVGYANDYFTTGLKNCGDGDRSSDWCMDGAAYNKVAETSFSTYMRGEIPYNENSSWGFDELMDSETVLRVLKEHHYSALDITQNFSDNITYWKQVKVYPALLKKNNIFFDEDYFKDQGEWVPRSLYQFIRDHLGYRLNCLPGAEMSVSADKQFSYKITFTNTGFATVLNPKPVYLVFIQDNHVVKEVELTDVNPKDWQPWAKGAPTVLLEHTISGQTALTDLPSGQYTVGLWIPDGQPSLRDEPAYCIKFSTDNGVISHWTGDGKTVNIIGTINF